MLVVSFLFLLAPRSTHWIPLYARYPSRQRASPKFRSNPFRRHIHDRKRDKFHLFRKGKECVIRKCCFFISVPSGVGDDLSSVRFAYNTKGEGRRRGRLDVLQEKQAFLKVPHPTPTCFVVCVILPVRFLSDDVFGTNSPADCL
ncbi:hypothetical protein AVEN_34852-1 [Araneus ventricosus]|uniref:Secreted protein n=1 Tax=Araneus ventricosus TaxID=182803 RepID=A0A4Y2LYN9_ARAVE|nr:hypothetical protein AVEN_34852-1 [Araneus ventricosus]